MKRFNQKVVIVTGGSYGLGRAVAIDFAKEGAKVVIADIDTPRGEETLTMVNDAGGEAIFVETDVSKETEVKTMVQKTIAAFGKLDFIINNAGITQKALPVTEQTEEVFDAVINTNVKGVWLGMKYAIPEILENGGGAVVNISSGFDQTAAAGVAFYVASKHAITGLTKAAALEFVQKGVRINAVSPGGMRTGMVEEFARINPELMKKTEEAHPIGRIAEPPEISKVVLFLCTEDAGFIIGHSLKADGGYVIQ